MTVAIRKRRPSDLGPLSQILRLVHENDGYPARHVEEPAAWLSGERVRAALVATEKERVLGHVSLASVTGDRAEGLWREAAGPAEQLLVIKRLFVDPGRRGEGLGRKLLEAAVSVAHRQGARPVLDVDVESGANALYLRAGFVAVGDLEMHWSGMTEVFVARCYLGPPPPVGRAPGG